MIVCSSGPHITATDSAAAKKNSSKPSNGPELCRHITSMDGCWRCSGEKGETRKLLAELMQRMKERYVPPYWLAMIYRGLGENEEALKWLEKACCPKLPVPGVR